MSKGSAVSVYFNDETLRQLDDLVATRASYDRAKGLSGYAVTNRSKLISEIVSNFLEHDGEAQGFSIRDIKEIVAPIAYEYGVERLSLFGSYARGEETANSDIDLLLEKGKVKGAQVFDLQDDLANALGKPVDVVTTQGASDRFLEKIKKDEVVLYESKRAG